MTVSVAIVQLNTGNNPVVAIKVLETHIRRAAAAGAQLITTPETSHLMEMNRAAVLEKACFEADDPGLKRLQALAAELKIWLHIGSLIIKVSDEKLANRGFLITDDGAVKARYDKLHLFDVDLPDGESYRESRLYEAGTEAVIAETPFGTIGLSICYDLRFPHLYREMAMAGADILMVPSAFTVKTGAAHWHTLLQARAIETGCYVLAAAQTGLHATGRSTYGHSLAVDPWGRVLADAGDQEGVIMVDLDIAKVAKTRQTIPALQHGRPFSVVRVKH